MSICIIVFIMLVFSSGLVHDNKGEKKKSLDLIKRAILIAEYVHLCLGWDLETYMNIQQYKYLSFSRPGWH